MYAELNEEKTQIAKRYGVGKNLKSVSFSINSTHEDYVAHGLYKIIDESPTLPEGKKLGDRTFSVNEEDHTVDISRAIADKTDVEKKVDRNAAQKPLKRTGVNLGGVMASATRDDQNGLTAISVGVIMARSAGNTFPDTLFQFVNGNELLITDANFDGYFATWSAFRQGFFAP